MERDFDAVVIGLGGIGSGAAYWLARRGGLRVLGLERFELGHDRGASQDHSRIIRRSYHTPGYVAMAGLAYEAWSLLEEEAGERLIIRTGGLDLWPEDAAIPMAPYLESLRASGVPFEELEGAEVMRRWPQWRLEDSVRAIFQEDGGIAPAARCNEAHRRMALEHGARLLDRSPVTAVRDDGAGELVVEVAGERLYRAGRVVLAVDAWTNELLRRDFGLCLPLTITQEQVTYFRASRPDAFSPLRFPVWTWMDDPSFYGLPAYGEAGPKAAQDCGGDPVGPDTRTFEPNAKAGALLRDFLGKHLPAALGPEILTKTCLYTLTPDRDFIIDAVPGHPGALVALGAAHGFKFASLLGRILADLACEGTTEVDLGPFRIDRPILRMDDPPTDWLV